MSMEVKCIVLVAIQIPLHLIESLEIRDLFHLHINCKDARSFRWVGLCPVVTVVLFLTVFVIIQEALVRIKIVYML